MRGKDDEEEERRRQAKERAKLSIEERLHGAPIKRTKSGFKDGRSLRRTLRDVTIFIRAHPRIKAMVEFLMARDGHASQVAFFEVMLEAYMKEHGEIDRSQLPTDEDLADQLEDARDKNDRDESDE
jgi:hypothetical protein